MDEAQHLVERERWFKWHIGSLLVAVGVGVLYALLRRQEDDVWMRIRVFIGIGIAMYGVSAVVGRVSAALGF